MCGQCFLCRSIVFCQTCTKCPTYCTKCDCRSQTKPVLGNLGNLGGRTQVIRMLKEGYTLPFQTRPNLTRKPTIVSCYVNPHRNLYLLETLHQLTNKNAIELVTNHESLGFYNRLFLVPKPNNKWRPI